MISKKADPVYIDMEYKPFRGILVNNESELIIGGDKGHMSKYSLDNPAEPKLLLDIKISDNVFSIVKMSEDKLLCG